MIKSSKQIKSVLDTWVDPRSKVNGWKVKVLDVYPDDYAGSTTAKVELFDPEGNSQGEDIIYVHRQDIKIGETYDARIDGLMAMPRIIGVPNISYDEVPSMKNVTRERYLKSSKQIKSSPNRVYGILDELASNHIAENIWVWQQLLNKVMNFTKWMTKKFVKGDSLHKALEKVYGNEEITLDEFLEACFEYIGDSEFISTVKKYTDKFLSTDEDIEKALKIEGLGNTALIKESDVVLSGLDMNKNSLNSVYCKTGIRLANSSRKPIKSSTNDDYQNQLLEKHKNSNRVHQYTFDYIITNGDTIGDVENRIEEKLNSIYDIKLVGNPGINNTSWTVEEYWHGLKNIETSDGQVYQYTFDYIITNGDTIGDVENRIENKIYLIDGIEVLSASGGDTSWSYEEYGITSSRKPIKSSADLYDFTYEDEDEFDRHAFYAVEKDGYFEVTDTDPEYKEVRIGDIITVNDAEDMGLEWTEVLTSSRKLIKSSKKSVTRQQIEDELDRVLEKNKISLSNEVYKETVDYILTFWEDDFDNPKDVEEAVHEWYLDTKRNFPDVFTRGHKQRVASSLYLRYIKSSRR